MLAVQTTWRGLATERGRATELGLCKDDVLLIVVIVVASYGALGHVPPPPSPSNCLIFQVTAKPQKLPHSTSSRCLSSKNSISHWRILHRFVAAYCVNLIIFSSITFELLSFSFLPRCSKSWRATACCACSLAAVVPG